MFIKEQSFMSEHIRKAFYFEDFCNELFSTLGYKVEKNKRFFYNGNFTEVDLFTKNLNNEIIIIECKFYRTTRPTYNTLKQAVQRIIKLKNEIEYHHAILIIATTISNELRLQIQNEFDIIVLDNRNILWLIKDNNYLLNKYQVLMADLSEDILIDVIDGLNLQEIIGAGTNPRKTEEKNIFISEEMFKKALEEIKKGKEEYRKYENICLKILKYLFEINLSGWNEQETTDDNLNRFDLVCRVNKGNEFWNFIINEFGSRYVIFEFKNYEEEIEQTQIYTTEKYLFKTALRNVAFIISREGASKNAISASKGILRESGKLMINIKDNQLIEMVKMKNEGSEPSDYLFEIVDKYLLEIGK